jgi:hypothetical protein
VVDVKSHVTRGSVVEDVDRSRMFTKRMLKWLNFARVFTRVVAKSS